NPHGLVQPGPVLLVQSVLETQTQLEPHLASAETSGLESDSFLTAPITASAVSIPVSTKVRSVRIAFTSPFIYSCSNCYATPRQGWSMTRSVRYAICSCIHADSIRHPAFSVKSVSVALSRRAEERASCKLELKPFSSSSSSSFILTWITFHILLQETIERVVSKVNGKLFIHISYHIPFYCYL